MYKPTDDELKMLRRIAVEHPRFEEYLNNEREDARDLLENVEAPVQRGRAQCLTYLMRLIRRGEPTR